MAALDRRNLNLDDFVGLNWSCWADRVNIPPSDAGCNAEDGKNGRGGPQSMTLRKEDMSVFGHCPAHDDFVLVVCGHCGLLVKPQAFQQHCERLHAAVAWTCGTPPAQAPPPRPSPRKDGGDAAASPGHRSRTPKDRKEAASLSSAKSSAGKAPPLHPSPSSSTPRPRVPPWPSAPPPPPDSSSSSSTTPSERLPVHKAPPTAPPCPLRGMRTYSRTNRSLNRKESEPNKVGDVFPDPEKKKASVRQLLCSTDSIHQQQQSADQRRANQTQPNGGGEKRSFGFGSNLLRSKVPSDGVPQGKGGSALEAELKPAFSFSHGMLSSEGSEEEEEEAEEEEELPATSWHPKPLGLCTFGCRTLGCSIFTFDRRLHRLRFALSAMLERHADAHRWKKVPPVSSGLRSSHRATPPLVGATPPPVQPSLRLQSTSAGPSAHQNSLSTRRPFHPSTAATAARPPPTPRSSPKHIRDRPLHEKSQPTAAAAAHASTPPRVKKPCGPLSLNPSECKVPGYDRRPLAAKRKGGGASLAPGPKRKRPASPSRATMVSMETIEDVLGWGLEKRADA
ncbi:unnamed protein product [Ophioblennius macclurei]